MRTPSSSKGQEGELWKRSWVIGVARPRSSCNQWLERRRIVGGQAEQGERRLAFSQDSLNYLWVVLDKMCRHASYAHDATTCTAQALLIILVDTSLTSPL
eukprot:1148073-Pelagomonas_calceolata.AAC.23